MLLNCPTLIILTQDGCFYAWRIEIDSNSVHPPIYALVETRSGQFGCKESYLLIFIRCADADGVHTCSFFWKLSMFCTAGSGTGEGGLFSRFVGIK